MTVSHFTPRSRDDLIEVLQYTRADGIIFLGQSSFHEAFNELADRRYRFVVWGAELAGQRYCSVGSDNRGGAMRATRHLLRLGRNRIAFLGSPLNPEIEQRLAGYRTAILDANLAIDERLIVGSYFDLEAAESAIDALVASRVRFDAIVASSDILAFAAIRSLTRHGLRVPEDVAIVGYDNVSLGRYIRPALSTISQDVGMAGRMLVSKLLTPGPIVMPKSDRLATNLIVRESCGG